MIAMVTYAFTLFASVFAIKINDFKSFQQICVCNGLITGVLRIGFIKKSDWNKFFLNIECDWLLLF